MMEVPVVVAEASGSLISPDNTWVLWAVIISGTGLAIWLEQHTKWAAKISGPVVALIIAMTLSNIRVMPTESAVYDVIGAYLVPLAIPLLLFRANIVRIIRTTGTMFIAFHVSALGTLLGAAVATVSLHRWVAGLGKLEGVEGSPEELAQMAGIMTGSYTGGSVNFIAVAESFDVSSQLTNPLIVADNFIMAGMFIALLFISANRFILRHFRHPHSRQVDPEQARNLAAEHWKPKKIGLVDIAKALAVAFVIVAAAQQLSSFLAARMNESLLREIVSNVFVLITTLSVLAATLFHRPMSRINGPEEFGSYLLYVFLFVIGLPANLGAALANVPVLFVFCLVMAVVNLVVTLGLGKLLRLGIEELTICVNATLGGPPSAAAMAIAKGWPDLVLPALLVGIWGYVIGTILGVAVGKALVGIL